MFHTTIIIVTFQALSSSRYLPDLPHTTRSNRWAQYCGDHTSAVQDTLLLLVLKPLLLKRELSIVHIFYMTKKKNEYLKKMFRKKCSEKEHVLKIDSITIRYFSNRHIRKKLCIQPHRTRQYLNMISTPIVNF